MIRELTEKLLKGQDLDFIETKEVFDEILSGLACDINSSAFLTALSAKGATQDELTAGISTSNEALKKYSAPVDEQNLIQNIIFSKNNEYFNFALTNDIICMAQGLFSIQTNFKSQLLKSPYFDILKYLDITPKENLEYDFENINLIYSYLSTQEPFFKYTFELSRKLDNDILKTINYLLNPLRAKNIFLGLNSKNDVEKMANIVLKLNYANSIILSNEDNLGFIHPNKKTYVAEAWKNKIFTYIITPDLLDMKEVDISKYKIESDEHCASLILDILNNKNKGAIYDGIIANAGLALYISKKADSLASGLDLARYTIDSSKAIEKFNQIKEFYK